MSYCCLIFRLNRYLYFKRGMDKFSRQDRCIFFCGGGGGNFSLCRLGKGVVGGWGGWVV